MVAVLILANFVLCVEELSCSGKRTGRACFYDFQLMFARNSRTTECTYSDQAENMGRSFSGKLPLRAGKLHAISWSTVTQHSKIHYQEMGYAQHVARFRPRLTIWMLPMGEPEQKASRNQPLQFRTSEIRSKCLPDSYSHIIHIPLQVHQKSTFLIHNNVSKLIWHWCQF